MDEDIQKILKLIFKKWKLIILFALVGALLAYVYTSNFISPTYTSSVKFLAYVEDEEKEQGANSNVQTASNTSKMNYAMKMVTTYLELVNTNKFYSSLAKNLNERLGTNYSADMLHSTITGEPVEETAMFVLTVTTTDPTLSYNIAQQLENDVPPLIFKASNKLVNVSVQDPALLASSAVSLGYPKKNAYRRGGRNYSCCALRRFARLS